MLPISYIEYENLLSLPVQYRSTLALLRCPRASKARCAHPCSRPLAGAGVRFAATVQYSTYSRPGVQANLAAYYPARPSSREAVLLALPRRLPCTRFRGTPRILRKAGSGRYPIVPIVSAPIRRWRPDGDLLDRGGSERSGGPVSGWRRPACDWACVKGKNI
jgi:hypothetical protein